MKWFRSLTSRVMNHHEVTWSKSSFIILIKSCRFKSHQNESLALTYLYSGQMNPALTRCGRGNGELSMSPLRSLPYSRGGLLPSKSTLISPAHPVTRNILPPADDTLLAAAWRPSCATLISPPRTLSCPHGGHLLSSAVMCGVCQLFKDNTSQERVRSLHGVQLLLR